MFSIIIPTLNNLNYLRLCIKSLRVNSTYTHQIIPHVNIGEDGTVDFLKKEKIEYTFTKYNAGICEGMNMASKKAKKDFILYAHDDFYFCPTWDLTLKNEIDKIGHNKFYLSGIMMNNGPLKFDCGNSLETFNAFMGFDFVSLGRISIFSSSILFTAILIDLMIFSPIAEFSPLRGTINPILIFSFE